MIELLGGSAFGAIVVFIALLIGCFFLWLANRRSSVDPHETISENPAFKAKTPEPAPAQA